MRIYYRSRGSSVGVSGSPIEMYLLGWTWLAVTLCLTALGLAIALCFGLCWLAGRLLRPRWPNASIVICSCSSRAAHGVMHAVDVMNGHA